jgi:hypothetical protein
VSGDSTAVQLIAMLGELDSRRLYRAEGYSSLFTYCRTSGAVSFRLARVFAMT